MFAQEDKAKDREEKKGTKVIGEALLIGKDEIIMKKIDYEGLVKIGEDEVVMKKKEVEEKEKRIAELEKHGIAVEEDEVIVKKKEVEAMKIVIMEFEK